MWNWNEDNVKALTAGWQSGKSAAVIAGELGITRNAVIGKVHRLGLSSKRKRKTVVLAGAPARSRRLARRKSGGNQEPIIIVPVGPPEPVEGGISLLALDHFHCRAVIGVGDDGLARYCGAEREKKADGLSSYCLGHGNLYYRRDFGNGAGEEHNA